MNDFEKLMKNPIIDEIWESEKEDFERFVLEYDTNKSVIEETEYWIKNILN